MRRKGYGKPAAAFASSLVTGFLVNGAVVLYAADAERDAAAGDTTRFTSATPPSSQSQEQLATVIDRLQESLADVRTLRTRFVQETRLDVLLRPIESHGHCFFESPDRVRFQIDRPFETVTIANGDRVAKYERIDGKWRRLELPSAEPLLMVMRQIAAWLQGDFEATRRHYRISGWGSPRPVIILKPREQDMAEFIAAIELHLDPSCSRFEKVVLCQLDGGSAQLQFSADVRNEPFEASVFDTTLAAPTVVSLPSSSPSAKQGPAEAPSPSSSDKDK